MNNSRDLEKWQDTLYFIAPDRAGLVAVNGNREDVRLLRKTGVRKLEVNPKTEKVWFGFSDGIYSYKNGQLHEITFLGKAVFASEICFDGEELVVATYQDGIFRSEGEQLKKLLQHPEDHALDQVKSIYADHEIIAAATLKGLLIYHRKENKEVLVNKYDGLAYKEINRIIRFQNELFLATLKGLVRIPINGNYFNSSGPSIAAVQLKLNNKIISFRSTLEMAYNDNDLVIDLTATGFRSRGDFKYQFRLLPLNENWKELEAHSPRIIIHSLAPGFYSLEIAAQNEDHVRSSQPLVFSLVVKPPFWQKWWFYILVGLCFAGLAALFFQIRIRYIRKKAEREITDESAFHV